jgi:hypothetical protein
VAQRFHHARSPRSRRRMQGLVHARALFRSGSFGGP